MFQDHALFPHLDVGRNIEFGLRARDWDGERRRRRVAELLDLVGLAGFERRTIERLSGGERQRVALARALAPSPRLLMLDEPLASLDRGLRERLARELREILGSIDIPTLYVTHDQFEAFALAQRVAIMDQGQIARVGNPTAIWDNPKTEFVARFLGMENIVAGERGADGWVTTEVGSFGPMPGPPGKVRLLLRDDGPELVHAAGPNVASGEVRASAFRGSTSLLTVARGLEELEFSFPAGTKLPEVGKAANVRVHLVQEMERAPESLDAAPPL
jgi:ABC-type Fe3+/spermidine/putrescine transport system ATPase subunit